MLPLKMFMGSGFVCIALGVKVLVEVCSQLDVLGCFACGVSWDRWRFGDVCGCEGFCLQRSDKLRACLRWRGELLAVALWSKTVSEVGMLKPISDAGCFVLLNP